MVSMARHVAYLFDKRKMTIVDNNWIDSSKDKKSGASSSSLSDCSESPLQRLPPMQGLGCLTSSLLSIILRLKLDDLSNIISHHMQIDILVKYRRPIIIYLEASMRMGIKME